MWQYIWNYRQQDYLSWPSKIGNQLQVIRVRVNQQSSNFRMVFSNLYGKERICFDKVEVALLDEQGVLISDPLSVTIDEQESFTIEVGRMEQVSDPIHLTIYPQAIIEIKTYLTKETILTGGIVSYSRLQQEVLNYSIDKEDNLVFQDQAQCFELVKNNSRMFYIYGVSGIQCTNLQHQIVVFGDSLTQQGFWLDQLKQRLLDEKISDTAILNKGIGGGRILSDTAKEADDFQRHGRAGVKRYLSDVFSHDLVTSVILFYGINDLMTVDLKTTDDELIDKLINAYQFFCEEAHRRQTSIYLCTILPFGRSPYYSERAENLRQRLNQWIRTTDLADGFFDFSEAVAEKENPKNLIRDYECGDGLHLAAKGGKKVASVIDVTKLIKGVN